MGDPGGKGRNPLMERCDAIVNSQRFKVLCDSSPSFEPSCMERKVVYQLGDRDGDIRTCLYKIPEIFSTIAKITTVVRDGQAVVRKREVVCRNAKCSNNNPNRFDYRKGGMIACMECGECIEELLVEEGAQYRDFTGEESRNHHGDAPNPYMSANYNTGTSFRGYRGAKTSMGRERDYSMGSAGGSTTIEYKDDQKMEAMRKFKLFIKNNDVHQIIMDKAMTLFAAYRDAVEKVYNKPAVLAACMIAAMLEATIEDGEGKDFKCAKCREGFGTKRDLESHPCVKMVRKRPSRSAAAAVANDDIPAIHRMDLGEVEAYIGGLFRGQLQYFARGVSAGLMKEMRQGNDSDDDDDDDDDDVDRGLSRLTAGQHLMLAGLSQLTEWMGQNEGAAKMLHEHLNEVKNRRRQRDAARLQEKMEKPRIFKKVKSEDLTAAGAAAAVALNGGGGSGSINGSSSGSSGGAVGGGVGMAVPSAGGGGGGGGGQGGGQAPFNHSRSM